MRAFLATSLLALLLPACEGRGGIAANRVTPDSLRQAEARGEWVTIEGVDFPAAMAKAPDEVKEAYVFAAKHPEVLRYMPCYCGCERDMPPDHTGHTSNYDCFVDQIDRSGERPRVDVDEMGFG